MNSEEKVCLENEQERRRHDAKAPFYDDVNEKIRRITQLRQAIARLRCENYQLFERVNKLQIQIPPEDGNQKTQR